jgi:hypothetical protein
MIMFLPRNLAFVSLRVPGVICQRHRTAETLERLRPAALSDTLPVPLRGLRMVEASYVPMELPG